MRMTTYITQCVDEGWGEFNGEALMYIRESNTALVDNGSYKKIYSPFAGRTIRLPENVGGNAIPYVIREELLNDDISAFIHADFIINDLFWDSKIKNLFERRPELWLVGLVGSNEIDENGGRRCGTVSNFMGYKYTLGNGSPAEAHGGRICWDFQKAAVIDGCAMIYRTNILEKFYDYWKSCPPFHFEDRNICCEVLSKGGEIGIIGIPCDHINGAKKQCLKSYERVVRKWITENRPDKLPELTESNYDSVIYSIAEEQFLKKWRDEKHLIPIKIIAS